MALALILLPLLAAGGDPRADRPETTSLVLIVASNRGAQLGRPPLRYADDDGAKYREVFAALAGPENTILLTDLDTDTAGLFPDLAPVVRRPTRAEVDAAGRELSARAALLRQAGRQVRFYFVFAGHGDVDQGRGFLELVDGPFTSDDLHALVRSVGAAETHVVLDSCNSFFVVNPRKPGGRRFATPREAAERMARRLPDVGVFLSTSAEAEVFEWSELQSGVFSHAVRSGMLGAADVDRDDRISYLELAAFVETAAAEIKNPLFRPQVFARGPNGRDEGTLVDLASLRRTVLAVTEPGPVRLAARDEHGLRWLDAYKEAGASLEVWLPRPRLEVSRLRADGASPGEVVATYLLPDDGQRRRELGTLEPAAREREPRGAGDVFRSLFARPFGPSAYGFWVEERAHAPEPVYGVSQDDAERMGLLLEQLAASERERRTVQGAYLVLGGAGMAAFTALAMKDMDAGDRGLFAGVGFGSAAALLLLGVHDWRSRSLGEATYASYRAGMTTPGADQAQVVAETDRRLHALLAREARDRQTSILAGGGLLVVGLAFAVDPGSSETTGEKVATQVLGVALACGGAGMMLSAYLSDTPLEKLITLWERDPGIRRIPSVSVLPARSGAVLVMSGEF